MSVKEASGKREAESGEGPWGPAEQMPADLTGNIENLKQ